MVHHHSITRVRSYIPFYVSFKDPAFNRMIVFKIPIVYPNTWNWAFLLLMVGVLGFVAQVSITIAIDFYIHPGDSLLPRLF